MRCPRLCFRWNLVRPQRRQRRQRLQRHRCRDGRLFSRRWWCWRFQSARSRCLRFAEPFLLLVEVFSDQIGGVHLRRRWFWTPWFHCFLNCLLRHCLSLSFLFTRRAGKPATAPAPAPTPAPGGLGRAGGRTGGPCLGCELRSWLMTQLRTAVSHLTERKSTPARPDWCRGRWRGPALQPPDAEPQVRWGGRPGGQSARRAD